MEIGNWKLEVGCWKLEVGSWKSEVRGSVREGREKLEDVDDDIVFMVRGLGAEQRSEHHDDYSLTFLFLLRQSP